MAVVYAPMHEIIEDYGSPTQTLCLSCRSAKPARFRFLQKIVFQEADPTQLADWFLVCPFCDVSQDARS